MKTHRIICIVAMSFIFWSVHPQKGKIRQATKEYEDLAYLKTSEILLEVANKGYRSVGLFEKLANSFYFNNHMEAASKWYGELMAMDGQVDPEYYFRYAQTLKSVGDYTESDRWMTKFHEANSDDLRGRAFASRVDYLSMINEASRDFEVYNLGINSEVSDFGTAQYKDQLIFASTRGGGKEYQWNGQPFLDLFSARKQGDGTYGDVRDFSKLVNTKYHESTVSFTPDNKVMYFTRNNYFNKKYKQDNKGINRLKLFRADLGPYDTWKNISSIPFNSNDYSVAHPTVNAQGSKLYFASDMPGTLGQSDIFEAEIKADGSLGEPVNLGPLVNTEGQETFPFINSKGDLYYSSNGFTGLGGLDVFVIRDFENRIIKSHPLPLQNLGRPINSRWDDFGYYENLGAKEGFFTSNREGGKGDDDIYSFRATPCQQTVEGVVKDKKTLALLAQARVVLYDQGGGELQDLVVGGDASFAFKVACGKEYLVRAEKDTYTGDEKRFTTPTRAQELKLELLLEKDEQEIKPGDDLAALLDIPIIYFDFDKYNIRYDAEVELQKVLAVLEKHPTMVIDIRSHTDCRGSYAYNETLSGNRAKSTRSYLIGKGITASRLTAKGYGESQLVNHCACEGQDSVYCSEPDHQLNRRSEFIIVSM